MRKASISFVLILLKFSITLGQIKAGVDIYSRYIWRGIDFGNAPSYQPAISYSIGDLSFGVWGAFSSTGSYDENDIWVSYKFENTFGTFVINYTDYYFPSAGIKFFNYKGNGSGAHILEVGLGYMGINSFPISINGYYNFHNDVDNSIYIQLAYPISLDTTYSINLFAGFTGRSSALYGTASESFLNLGFTISKSIKISESFSLPLSMSYILNLYLEKSWLIFGLSI